MGIRDEDLLDPGAVSNTLRCPVCMEVFEDPVFCGGEPCQHVFCNACAKQALELKEECPTCRAEMRVENLMPHQVIRSLLDELPARCGRGCGWVGRRELLPGHAAVCPLALLEAAQAKLQDREAQYADMDRLLTERDDRIRELEAIVEVREQDAKQGAMSMVQYITQISDLEKQLRIARGQLAAREAELASLRGFPCRELPAAAPHCGDGLKAAAGGVEGAVGTDPADSDDGQGDEDAPWKAKTSLDEMILGHEVDM